MGAASVLRKIKEAKKEKVSSAPELDGGVVVRVAGFDRGVRLVAVARYWRLLSRREKAISVQLDAVKGTLREAAKNGMAEIGGYVAGVKVGGVSIRRSNKYGPAPVGRDELIDAVGGSEYAVCFKEEAALKFASVAELRQHVRACELAGVEVCGEISEVVKPRSCIGEKVVSLAPYIDQERLAVLEACAVDQAMMVGRAK